MISTHHPGSSQSISIYHWEIGAKISVSVSISRFLRVHTLLYSTDDTYGFTVRGEKIRNIENMPLIGIRTHDHLCTTCKTPWQERDLPAHDPDDTSLADTHRHTHTDRHTHTRTHILDCDKFCFGFPWVGKGLICNSNLAWASLSCSWKEVAAWRAPPLMTRRRGSHPLRRRQLARARSPG